MIRVRVANHQTAVRVDRRRVCRAVRMVLRQEGIHEAQISVAVVDDAAIRQLHRRYLGRNEPTDVLSFLLERSRDGLEGEIVVSGQTARRLAREYRWTAARELLLYVVHGALHLAGWRDRTRKERAAMRSRQREYLTQLGVNSVRSEK